MSTTMSRIHWRKIAYQLNWLHVIFLVFIPTAGCVRAWWLPLQWKTCVWAYIYFCMTGTSITAGYHRLWAHKSYTAGLPLQIYLALFGAGAIEGSIKRWSIEHRAHHRYTDTDKDPYGAHRGLLHSHIFWMLIKEDRQQYGRVDISDLKQDPLVMWQHRNFMPIALFMGWAFPTAVAGFGWGDWHGGFVYAGILRAFLVNQATFCVNSLAHYAGDQPYDDRRSPKNHLLTAIITLGEGYHNFHHEFPYDYRNGVEWHQFDTTKYLIWTWKVLGLATNLRRACQSEINKSKLQQLLKRLDRQRAQMDWGPPVNQLPVLHWNEILCKVNEGQELIVVENIVHDLGHFVSQHPGGQQMICSYIGKDATSAFNGAIYTHSNAAHNFLATRRVGVLGENDDVDVNDDGVS